MSADDPQPQRSHAKLPPFSKEYLANKQDAEHFGEQPPATDDNIKLHEAAARLAGADGIKIAAPTTDDKPQNRCPISYAHLPHDYCDGTAAPRGKQWTMTQPKVGDKVLRFLTPCCGYEFLANDCPVKWNEFNSVVQCHNCGQLYNP